MELGDKGESQRELASNCKFYEPLLDVLQSRLAAANYRLGTAIDTIIRSPQFRMIRGRDFSEDALP